MGSARRVLPTVVLSGVAGSGKSTVGRAPAARMSLELVDADDYHSPAAVECMRRGPPLTEEARREWLTRLIDDVEGHLPLVISCSNLRRSHRDRRRTLDDVRMVVLDVPRAELHGRLIGRTDHLFDPALLDDQLSNQEPPAAGKDVWIVDVRHRSRPSSTTSSLDCRPGDARSTNRARFPVRSPT